MIPQQPRVLNHASVVSRALSASANEVVFSDSNHAMGSRRDCAPRFAAAPTSAGAVNSGSVSLALARNRSNCCRLNLCHSRCIIFLLHSLLVGISNQLSSAFFQHL